MEMPIEHWGMFQLKFGTCLIFLDFACKRNENSLKVHYSRLSNQ